MYLNLFAAEKEIIRANRRRKFKYQEFIKSELWTAQKAVWYSRHKKRCARCRSTRNVHLHHKKYPKSGRYLSLADNDFVAFCGRCHAGYHAAHDVQKNMQTKSNRFIKSG
jgi:hypothetical protein